MRICYQDGNWEEFIPIDSVISSHRSKPPPLFTIVLSAWVTLAQVPAKAKFTTICLHLIHTSPVVQLQRIMPAFQKMMIQHLITTSPHRITHSMCYLVPTQP